MSSRPFISIIVPVFNAESYLDRCVNSILDQSYSDFELLLIDDGSKDRSGAKCDEYALSDVRVKVFHQPNGGVSRARNLGIDNASGEYVCFVDSDDYLASDYLESFDSLGTSFDIFVQGVILIKEPKEQAISLEPAVLKDVEAMSLYVGNVLPFTPQGYPFRLVCSKLFRRSLFDGVRYNPEISMFEDYIVNSVLYRKAKSMRVTDGSGYFYVQSNSVLSRRRYPIHQYLDWNAKLNEELYRLSQEWHATRMFEQILDIRLFYLFSQQMQSKWSSIGEKLAVIKFIHSSLNQKEWIDVSLMHRELYFIKRFSPSWLAFLILKLGARFHY